MRVQYMNDNDPRHREAHDLANRGRREAEEQLKLSRTTSSNPLWWAHHPLAAARKHGLSMFATLVDAFSGIPFTPVFLSHV